jgi:hypothetical protein
MATRRGDSQEQRFIEFDGRVVVDVAEAPRYAPSVAALLPKRQLGQPDGGTIGESAAMSIRGYDDRAISRRHSPRSDVGGRVGWRRDGRPLLDDLDPRRFV